MSRRFKEYLSPRFKLMFPIKFTEKLMVQRSRHLKTKDWEIREMIKFLGFLLLDSANATSVFLTVRNPSFNEYLIDYFW